MNKRVLERVVGDEDDAVVDIRGCDYGQSMAYVSSGVVTQTDVNTGRQGSNDRHSAWRGRFHCSREWGALTGMAGFTVVVSVGRMRGCGSRSESEEV